MVFAMKRIIFFFKRDLMVVYFFSSKTSVDLQIHILYIKAEQVFM